MLTDTEVQYKWLRNQPKKSFSKKIQKNYLQNSNCML